MAEGQQSPLYLVKAEAARAAFDKLCEAKVHRTFLGYLCVKRTAAEQARTRDLKPNFKAFFDDFLAVAGAPTRSPYVVPFADSKGEKWSPFFNENVAGSYAPASLREVSPFRRVVDISGGRKSSTFGLLNNHAPLALKHLLYDQPLRISALVTFLYRDYGISMPVVSVAGLIEVFREEFGYHADVTNENEEFNLLYADDSALSSSANFKKVG